MVTNLWLIGRKDDAIALYERLLKLRNDVGLLSEEYDPVGKRLLGNFPQALTHIALIHAAYAISGMWRPESSKSERTFQDAADTTKSHSFAPLTRDCHIWPITSITLEGDVAYSQFYLSSAIA